MKKRNEKVVVRTIGETAADLRKRLGHTQQSWATLMGWAISSAVRFEHGAKPSARMLSQMLEVAHAQGFDDLAAEIQLHLNVALGPNRPIMPDETERYFVLIARRIFQNKKRHAAFLQFAAPEIEILKAEHAFRKENDDELWAGTGTLAERLKKEGKK